MKGKRPLAWLRPLAVVILSLWCGSTRAQQLADTAFHPPIPNPAFPAGQGPVVLIDEAHHNFHTAGGRFAPFADLLRRDGYRVGSLAEPFSRQSLSGAGILVVANALHSENVERRTLPVLSAFSAEEIDAVEQWVRSGGALLLVADHMPFPAAAADLAARFGIAFSNGFAMPEADPYAPISFHRSRGTLAAHSILQGRSEAERIDSVASFTGQAMQPTHDDVRPLLVLGEGIVSLEPQEAWVFDDRTPKRPAGGWLQGAAVAYGSGRVVILGEAAMLTAQRAGPQQIPVGMNAPHAAQNAQFVLNVLHWLSGTLP